MADLNSPTPTWVYPILEQYNVITTQSENMKKEYLLSSVTPQVQFRLVWTGMTDASFAGILAHWRGVSGTYAAFNWTCVPSYIDGGDGLGASMEGRWMGSPRYVPKSKSWDVELIFEKKLE